MLILALCSRCWWFYMIPWYIQEPVYSCVFADPSTSQDECTKENICTDPDHKIISHEIDWSDPLSLHNWIEKLDLICAPGWKLGLISSAYFFGWCITLLWFPVLADKYGRRRILIGGAILDLAMYTGIMITSNVDVMITLTFLEGLFASATQTVGFIYMMELLPVARQALIAGIYSCWDSCITYLLATLYFRYVSTYWTYLALIGYVTQILCVALVWFLPESPKFLIEQNRLDEAEAAFNRIAWFGRSRFDPIELNGINNGVRRSTVHSELKQSAVASVLRGTTKNQTSGLYQEERAAASPPLWFYLKQRPILVNLIALLFIWVATVFNSYLITYVLNNLGQVYVNYVCTSLTALVAYSIGGFMFVKLGLKKSMGSCFIISIFGGLSSLAYGLQHQDGWMFIVLWQFVQFGVSACFQILYVSHTSLFPTLFCSTSFGFLNFCSRFATILAPLVAQVAEPIPVIAYTLCAIIGLVSIFFTRVQEQDIRESMCANQANWQAVSQSQILNQPIRESQTIRKGSQLNQSDDR